MNAPRWNDAIDRMLTRIGDTAGRVREGFPYWADPETGQWTTTRDGHWTGGYWIGMLWLDATTGWLIRHYTHKGFSDTSTWGRAQAWGMLFATQSYLSDRRRDAWIAAAVRDADWWLARAPANRVAFWDFDDPTIPDAERDTAATAIATAALLRLSRAAPAPEARARYGQAAEATALALVDRYLTPTSAGDRRVPGMLVEACFNKRTDARPQDRANRCEFIVGSSYLLESLLALAGRLDPLRV
jgi:unsaturated chondroitin disaccharide hydrolase